MAGTREGGSPQTLVRAARAAGVLDERVLAAVAAVPRTAYTPRDLAGAANLDEPVPIPHGQVTTQPSLSAMMIAALGLTGQEHVLEVGTGYGYQSALLARLAADVVSIEIWPDLAEAARRNLAAEGVLNVHVVDGDGSEGWAPGAPYDRVIVSAAAPEVPAALVRQLRIGGRVIQPIGWGGDEDVALFERTWEGLRRLRSVAAARFVPLRSGEDGTPGRP